MMPQRECQGLSEQQLRRTLYITAMLVVFLPPFIGGSLMAFAGFYPLPEFYLIFTNISSIYVATVLAGILLLIPRFYRTLTRLPHLPPHRAIEETRRIFSRLPWYLLLTVTVYSMFGVLSADWSLERMGYADYVLRDYLIHQFGVVPVALLSSFPIFFYFIDRLGLYLGPRGIYVNATPLWVKLLMLGIVTPLLIDSLLIGYFYNRTGYFELETLVVWVSLVLLAIGGTWLAWRSIHQGLSPLNHYVEGESRDIDQPAQLEPHSLDELGVLTAHLAKLTRTLQQQRDYSNNVLNTAPIIILMLDEAGYITYVNPWFENLTGYSLDEIKGKEWFSRFVPERNRAQIRSLFQTATHDEPTRGNINPILRRDGAEIEVEWYDQAIRDEQGDLVSLLAIGQDVTERRLLEQQQFEQKEHLNILLETIPHGIQETDLSGTIIYSNPAHARMLGYEPGTLVGCKIWEFLVPSQQQGFQEYLHRLIELRPQPEPFMGQNITRDGCLISVSVDWDYRYDAQGELTGLIAIITDITGRVEAENALRDSQKRLSQAQEIAKIGNWELDLRTGRLIWSDTIYAIFELDKAHYSPDYGTFLELVHPDEREAVDAAYQQSLVDRKPYIIAHRLLLNDGRIKWVEERCNTDFAEDGTPLVSRGTVQDITEQKKAQIELEHYQQHLEELVKTRTEQVEEQSYRNNLIVNAAMDGFFLADMQGNIHDCNPAYCQMLGYERDELLRLHISDIEVIETAEETSRHIEKILDQGWDRFDTRHRAKNGRIIDVEVNVRLETVGQEPQFFAFVNDITERKQAESAIRLSRDEAAQANAAKSEFLSKMSHELRTPLTAILGFGQLLQTDPEYPLNAQQNENLDEIMQAGNHLLGLINEILEVSRIESKPVELSLEPVNLAPLLEQCVQQFQPLAEQRNISITSGNTQEWVMADSARLEQVIVNLLSNAVKYNRQDGRIRLWIDEASDTFLRISISDTGPGIDTADQALLFRPFERLGTAYDGVAGTGIGLALSRRLVEAMHGKIGMDSVKGEGSTFWLELKKAGPGESQADQSVVEQNRKINDSDRRTRILYVEDNSANLNLVRKLLAKRDDYQLLEATTAGAGLELARTELPALILMDINLPDMSGYEALQRLQADSQTREIPVIAVSANAMKEDISRAREAGFIDYLTKPLNVAQFLDKIQHCLVARSP